ncbi:tetratricopeptide repeat protein [Candidatus Uabimicrobium amorphum]|uniref:Lipopolysaccharide assembly protein B n=1 Tax=Uabimicrobium amorphum TaxID=2596890 RepID=A0A5S9F3X2_UABAM|nr:tetratricopeptide repeat protein [Candidatus Uabimicrobium amorphum]BBM83622.1 lipopolysaccharide assembly protein B [Candidatus Uabimicrobium amorphum]
MDDLVKKFAEMPHDTQMFEKLVHKYTREEDWNALIHLHIDHAQAIKDETKGEAYRYFLQAARLQKIHRAFSSETIDLLQTCMNLLPERDDAFLEMEIHYQNEKKWEELIGIYKQKIEHSSVVAQEELATNIANIYFFELKDLTNAACFYEKAATVNPQSKTIQFHLLDIYEKQQQYEKYYHVLEILINLSDTVEEKERYYFQLAELQFEQNKWEKAAQSYQKITGTPYRERIISRLEEIYKDDPDHLITVLNQKLDFLKAKEEKAKTYLQLARLKDEHFSELDNAIVFYEKALLLKSDINIIESICDVLWRKENIHEWYLYKKQKVAMLASKQEKAYTLHSCAVDLKASKQNEENIDRLVEIYENILQLSPGDEIAIEYLTQTYQALHRYEQLVKVLVHKSKYSSLAERVSIYYNIAKLLPESLSQQQGSYYQKVIAIQGDHNEALLQLRNKYTESKNYRELIKVIEDEIRLTAIDPEIRYHEIGTIYDEHLEDEDNAIAYFEKALASNSLFLPSYVSLRRLHKKRGEIEKYIEVGEKELTVNENKQESIDLHFSLAEMYVDRDREKQERHLRKILHYEPDETKANDILLRNYEEKGDWQKYVGILLNKAAFQPYSEDVAALYQQIATVYEEQLKDIPTAKLYYVKAHYLQPTQLDIMCKLSKICADLQQVTEQIVYLKKEMALTKDCKEVAAIQRKIADIYVQENDIDAALTYYKKATANVPDDLEILKTLEKLYSDHNRTSLLIANLNEQTFLVDDASKIDLYKRLADLSDNTDDKILYLQKLQQLDFSSAYVSLEECYRIKEMWTELSALYAKKLEEKEQLEILQKAANVYEEHIEDNYKLQRLYIKILAKTSDDTIFEKLERISYKIEDWEKVVEICQAKLKKTNDSEQIFLQMGEIYTKHIPDVDAAISHYYKALDLNLQTTTLQKLKSLHLVKLEYHKAIEIIDKLIDVTGGEHDLYIELGNIFYQHLREEDKAIIHYQKALEVDDESLHAIECLEKVCLCNKNYQLLIEILDKKQQLKDDPEIGLQIANIWQNFLNEINKAVVILEELSQKYPENIRIKEKLSSIYREQEDWQKLIAVYDERRKLAKSDAVQAQFLFLQGKIYEEELHDQKTAAEIYVKILTIIPGHLPTIKSLQRVYQKERNIAALTESYLAELAIADISRKRKEALHIFCAELFEKNLNEKDWAITHYLQVLKIDANNLVAIRGLQNLYRERKQYEKLVHVLIAELSIEKNARRLFLVEKELGEISLLQFENYNDAIVYYMKAHETLPEKHEVLARLQKLLRNEERWEEYTRYVEEELQYLSPKEKKKTTLELVDVYDKELSNKEKAIVHLESMLDEFGADTVILQHLQQLYGDNYEVDKLIDVLEKKLSFTSDNDAQVNLHFKIGSLLLKKLKEVDKAAVHFQKALELNPESKKIFNVLAKLYTKERNWLKLIELYSLRVRYVKGVEKEREFFYKMGTIFEKKLQRIDEAIKYYELALTVQSQDGGFAPALRSIRKLCEAKKDWTRVIEYLLAEVQHVKTAKERAALYFKIARIWEQKLGHPHQGVKYYLKVIDNHYHEPTAKHAIGLLKGIKNYTALCALLEQMIERCANEQKIYLLGELGNILFAEEHKITEAIAIYREILLLDSNNLQALNALETIYEKQRDWLEVTEIKRKKLEFTKQKNAICHLHIDLGRIYEHYLFEEKQAIHHYEQALKIQSQDVNLLHTLQNLYKNWGYFQEYLDLCHKEIFIINDNPRKIYLWSEMAIIWENRLFENNAAIICYKEILKIDSGNNNAIVALIRLYNYIEDYENLVDIYKLQISLALKANITGEILPLQLTTANILYHRLHRLDEAEEMYNKVLEISPENEKALEALRDLYKRKDDIEGQGQILEKAILLEKNRTKLAELYQQLGKVYEGDNRFEVKAAEAYEKAFEIENDAAILRILQKLYRDLHNDELLIGTNRRLLQTELSNKEQADLHFEMGCILHKKSLEKAVEEFQKVVEILPSHKKNLETLCQCWRETQNWSEFIAVMEQRISQESNRGVISLLYFEIGQVYAQQLENVDEAKNCYEKSIDYDRQNVQAIYHLADIFYEFQHWVAAQSLYQRLTHYPQKEVALEDIYYILGKISEKLSDTDTAILRYQKSVEYKADFALSLDHLANLYYDNAQWDEALLYYMKLENTPSRHAEIDMMNISLRLAIIKDKMGMTEGAIDGYLQHLKENRDQKQVLEGLARLHMEKGEWDTSIEYYEKLLQIEDSHQTLLKIAEVHEKNENWRECQLIYDKLCTEFPNNNDFFEKYITLSCKMQDWENAQSYVEKQMELCENNFQKVSCIMSLAKIHWEGSQDAEKAILSYEKTLEIIPQNFRAMQKIIDIYTCEKKYDQVIVVCEEYLQKFVEDDEEYKAILSSQAFCYLNHLDAAEKAADIYQRLCEIDPNHTEAHAALADIWATDKKQVENAITEHFYLILQNPFRRDSYNKLFNLYQKENLYDRMYLCCQGALMLGKLLPKEKIFLERITPRVPSGWLDTTTQEKFIPENMRGTLHEVMASVDAYTDKAYPPLWENYPSLEKQESFHENSEMQDCIYRILKFLSIDQVTVYTYDGDGIYLENTNPVSIVIGWKLWQKLTKNAQKFVVTRTLFYAARKQVMAYKLNNEEYVDCVSVLVESFAETGKPISEKREAIIRKLRNSLPRKIKKQLEERMDVLTEVFQADTNAYRLHLEKAANNCALLMSDSLKASIEGYCAVKNIDFANFRDTKYEEMIKALFCFNISEEHSVLRRELGLEIKWLK